MKINLMPFFPQTINKKPETINNKGFKLKVSSLKLATGFTLIELLVVIAIIGILAALGTVTYSDSQQKSRDSRRKSDLETIRKALELAKQDSAGSYTYPNCRTYTPDKCTINSSTIADDNTSNSNGTTNPDLIGTNYSYIKAVPVDPKTSSTYYTYIPSPANCAAAACTAFTLVACLENLKDPQKDSTNISPCDGTTNTSYTISNL